MATAGQGPLYQRVYRANADGSNLTLIAKLDSSRTSGMEDITVGPDDDIYVLTAQMSNEVIYRIDQNNKVSKFIAIATGRDPKSIDMDCYGNLWFCTTVGIFRAQH
jgi:streptogramin lyase